jgi:hypothetical protein
LGSKSIYKQLKSKIMARQRGPIKIEGTIGDITFLKTQDGYIAKEKTEIKGSRIASDPAFQRTRENNAEFGTAGKAGKLVRNVFRTWVKQASDRRVTSRLTKEILLLIKTDTTQARGLRSVQPLATELQQGFNFNGNAPLATVLSMPFTSTIDRDAGTLTVSIEKFSPLKQISAPAGSTHCKLLSAAAAINFDTDFSELASSQSETLPLTAGSVGPIELKNSLTPKSTDPLFLLLGIQFYQVINGIEYPFNDLSFNALGIVKVDGE